MKLDYHYFPRSHWSRVCSLVLAEKGLWDSAERHVVDIRTNANFAPDYLRINPKGVVPSVVIDGVAVCNTPVIVRALDALCPPAVHPDNPFVDLWAERLEELKLMHLSYHVWTKGERGEKSASILDDKVDRADRYAGENPDLSALYRRKRDFFSSFRDEVYDPDHRERTRQQTLAQLEALGVHVHLHGLIAGDRWTWPDALATSILWRLQDLHSGLAPWVDDPAHPLAAYLARLQARPSYQLVFHDDPALAEL